MSLRKYHVNKTVIFVTYSIEEGLLLRSNPLMQLVVRGCLAIAQMHHPVKIIDFLVEDSHIHFIMVVDNPSDIKGFAERFKTETAHRINTILGRKKRTVWCEGYDSPVVLTKEDVIRKIVYIYTNPAKDNLEESIDAYPGLSSWRMRNKGEFKKEWPAPHRTSFHKLSEDAHNLEGYTREADRINSKNIRRLFFEVSPNAWFECFDITDPAERDSINLSIEDQIRSLETQYTEDRKRTGHKVIGRNKLMHARLDTTYRPNRKGRKMWCICSDIPLRKQFLSFMKYLSNRAKQIYKMWLVGDMSEPFPLGLYPPSMPKLAERINYM